MRGRAGPPVRAGRAGGLRPGYRLAVAGDTAGGEKRDWAGERHRTVFYMSALRLIGNRSVPRADHWYAGVNNSRVRRLSTCDGMFSAADTPRLFNSGYLYTYRNQLGADRASSVCGYSSCARNTAEVTGTRTTGHLVTVEPGGVSGVDEPQGGGHNGGPASDHHRWVRHRA
jgi:hypothetical protein